MVTPMNTVQHQATCEDLLKVPDILIAEIVDGKLIASLRPPFPHACAVLAIAQDVSLYLNQFLFIASIGAIGALVGPPAALSVMNPTSLAFAHQRILSTQCGQSGSSGPEGDIPCFPQAPDPNEPAFSK